MRGVGGATAVRWSGLQLGQLLCRRRAVRTAAAGPLLLPALQTPALIPAVTRCAIARAAPCTPTCSTRFAPIHRTAVP